MVLPDLAGPLAEVLLLPLYLGPLAGVLAGALAEVLQDLAAVQLVRAKVALRRHTLKAPNWLDKACGRRRARAVAPQPHGSHSERHARLPSQ